MLTLYGYYRSGAAYRVRIGLHLKNIEYQDHFIHLRKGDQNDDSYRQINPQQLIPSLQLDDGTILTQSLAILEYLDTVYPIPALIPSDPIHAAKVRAFALAIACEIHPLNNLKVTRFLKHEFNIDALDQGWYCQWIQNGLSALEQGLPEQVKSTGFCFGDAPTLADVMLIPQLATAKRFLVPLDDYPKLMAVNKHCLSLPAFIEASPEQQADYEPEVV